MALCWRDTELLKNILNNLNYTLAQNVPISMKKERMKTVWPKSLQRWEVSKGLQDLVGGWGGGGWWTAFGNALGTG